MLRLAPSALLSVLLLAGVPARADPGFQETTKESEAAVKRATDWLLKAFNPDSGCGTDLHADSDIGCSAMVGLALLSQGNTPGAGTHVKRVNQVLNHILAAIDRMPPDDITPLTSTQLQNKIGRHAHTFFAALFLSQVVGEVHNQEKVRKALKKLVNVIEITQQQDGSWGDGSWAPVLGTVMGWSSLRGAYFTGFHVDASMERTEKKLVEQMKTQAQGWMHELYKNASGVRTLYATGKGEDPAAKKTMQDILRVITTDKTPFTQAGGEEFLAFHLINECMLQEGGAPWRKWFPVVRERLLEVQNEDGSWAGHHCITSRTFCTAAAVLVLTSPNRLLPVSQK